MQARKEFPTTLKERIAAKRIVQSDLARRLGTSQPMLSFWVNGRRAIPERFIEPLAMELGISAKTVRRLSSLAAVGEAAR